MSAEQPASGGEPRRLALFVANGLVATAVHYGALVLLLEVLLLPSAGLANGLAAIVGILISFAGNKLVVFRSERPAASTLPRFVALYAALALCHAAFLALWADWLGLPYGWGFLISTGLTTVLSYLGNRYFVFGTQA